MHLGLVSVLTFKSKDMSLNPAELKSIFWKNFSAQFNKQVNDETIVYYSYRVVMTWKSPMYITTLEL